ncbi:MAG: hypothetical protein J3R72DRAFT_492006 [Linnemannia gamsii]|nr:MAG: hypothetical protein J3R72DRAFT_492006 [Linnemannia gamsii]
MCTNVVLPAKERWDVEGVNFNENMDVSAKTNELAPSDLYRSIDCAGFWYAKSLVHRIERTVGLEIDSIWSMANDSSIQWHWNACLQHVVEDRFDAQDPFGGYDGSL